MIAAVLAVYTVQAAEPATIVGSDVVAPVRSAVAAPEHLDGAELFAAHCAMCHTPAELPRRWQDAADSEAARANMAAFLTRYGHSDTDADAAIVDYLAKTNFP